MSTIAPWYAPPIPVGKINTIAIIGGGLAGMSLAYHFTQQQFQVLLLDREPQLPHGASSNIAALVKPQLSPDDNLPDQYFTQSFLLFTDFIKNHPELILNQGILELSHSTKMQVRHHSILKKRDLAFLAHYVDAARATDIAGIPLEHSALYLHTAFLLDVPRYYQRLQQLCGHQLQIINPLDVNELQWQNHEWLINNTIHADAVIFAQGHQGFATFIDNNTLTPCPGQLSLIKPDQDSHLRCTLSFEGYLTPMLQGQHLLGASFRHNNDLTVTDHDHGQNLRYLRKASTHLAQQLEIAPWQGWCAMRTTSPDHLPLIGGVPIQEQWRKDYDRIKFGDFRARQYPDCTYYPNLYMSLAHGSKGVISSFHAGKILSNLLQQKTPSLSPPIWQAIHPARFWLRQLKKRDAP